MRENKSDFVKGLESLVKTAEEYSGIARLDYVPEYGSEYLYVSYKNGSQKRINISGNSCGGILRDFSNNINTASYLTSDDKRYRKEYLI